MNVSTDVQRQIEHAMEAIGAFEATCPCCGKIHAFHSVPRLRDYLTFEPGGPREVVVLLSCTRCAFVAAHTIEVGETARQVARAA